MGVTLHSLAEALCIGAVLQLICWSNEPEHSLMAQEVAGGAYRKAREGLGISLALMTY